MQILKTIWDFFQNQILAMKWLNELIGGLLGALGLDTGPMSGFDNAAVDKAFFADTPHVKSNFISTLGYGDPASIFDRSPRPDFDRFNRID